MWPTIPGGHASKDRCSWKTLLTLAKALSCDQSNDGPIQNHSSNRIPQKPRPGCQCKKTEQENTTREQGRPTPSSPDVRHHWRQVDHPLEDHQEVCQAPSAEEDAQDAGDAGNHIGTGWLELQERRHSRHRHNTPRPADPKIRHPDVRRIRLVGGSGCAERCWWRSVLSWQPSFPSAPSFEPFLINDVSQQVASAPSYP